MHRLMAMFPCHVPGLSRESEPRYMRNCHNCSDPIEHSPKW
ncbi:hypothetical protein Ahy_A05g022005 isoform B [Arachis hypogaea]|uniref:Uncharacterized protein n=1 Tax=Arachis hypogaea TaxID=3818 RepID=A0A445CZC4_ARAHY|nr:hypothetical protein Ahy_A05g022005 isoform B [Arachis hypogaea]